MGEYTKFVLISTIAGGATSIPFYIIDGKASMFTKYGSFVIGALSGLVIGVPYSFFGNPDQTVLYGSICGTVISLTYLLEWRRTTQTVSNQTSES